MAVVSTGYEYNFVETIGDQTTNIQKKHQSNSQGAVSIGKNLSPNFFV